MHPQPLQRVSQPAAPLSLLTRTTTCFLMRTPFFAFRLSDLGAATPCAATSTRRCSFFCALAARLAASSFSSGGAGGGGAGPGEGQRVLQRSAQAGSGTCGRQRQAAAGGGGGGAHSLAGPHACAAASAGCTSCSWRAGGCSSCGGCSRSGGGAPGVRCGLLSWFTGRGQCCASAGCAAAPPQALPGPIRRSRAGFPVSSRPSRSCIGALACTHKPSHKLPHCPGRRS